MILNWFEWEKDSDDIPKIHKTQKPVKVLKKLIEVFTDEGDVVIDPVCGSGSTLRAAMELNRSAYGFEINKEFYERAKNEMLDPDYKLHKQLKEDRESGQQNIFDWLGNNGCLSATGTEKRMMRNEVRSAI